jgi:hypothetical protein
MTGIEAADFAYAKIAGIKVIGKSQNNVGRAKTCQFSEIRVSGGSQTAWSHRQECLA